MEVNYKIISKKITEHYTIEFTDLIDPETNETVKSNIPIFDQVGNADYLKEAVERRYMLEQKRLNGE